MKRLYVYLFTVLFLAVAALCLWRDYAWDGTVEISALVPGSGGVEEIRSWSDDAGTGYLFLPGNVPLSQIQLRTHTWSAAAINGKPVTDGLTCGEFPTDTDLDLVYRSRGKEHHYTLRILQSENVASLYIDTASGTMDHIHEVKGNQEPGTARLYTPEGELNYAGNFDSLQGRGNDSWDKEKKPYSLELSADADLLGLGLARKWVLLANYSDPTHIRNKLVYDLAQELGMAYTPGCRWTDLYINGEYAGLYLLSERNELHPARVDIPREDSFLVSMEPVGRLMVQAYPYVATASGIAFRVRETGLAQDVMETILQTADSAIHASDGVDPVTGTHWQELMDLDSWARKYLVEEVFGNLDANAASQFCYYTGGKLFAGPVWDYDLSMGSHKVWQTHASDALFAAAPHIWSEEDHPWFAALIRQEPFRQRVVELYETQFRPQLLRLLESGIEDYAATITAAAAMNQCRFAGEDFGQHVLLVQNYLTQRLAFLDSYWLEGNEYHFVTINIRTGANIGCFAVRHGECLTQFPEDFVTWQGDNYGWYTADTQQLFDIHQPIEADVDLYLYWYPVQQDAPAIPREEPEEEPLSLLRLAPAIVFAGMLAAMCTLGLLRCRQERKKEFAHN